MKVSVPIIATNQRSKPLELLIPPLNKERTPKVEPTNVVSRPEMSSIPGEMFDDKEIVLFLRVIPLAHPTWRLSNQKDLSIDLVQTRLQKKNVQPMNLQTAKAVWALFFSFFFGFRFLQIKFITVSLLLKLLVHFHYFPAIRIFETVLLERLQVLRRFKRTALFCQNENNSRFE